MFLTRLNSDGQLPEVLRRRATPAAPRAMRRAPSGLDVARPAVRARRARCARRSRAARARSATRSPQERERAPRGLAGPRRRRIGARRRARPAAAEPMLAVEPGQLGQVHQDPDSALRLRAAGRTDRASRSASRRPRTGRRACRACRRATRPPRSTAAVAELRARRRRVRFDADRQVVVVDRLPDLLGLPFLARVDAAHRALQLGELAHHVGRRDRPSPAAPAVAACVGVAGCAERVARRSIAPARRSAPPCRGSCRASCGTAACRAARAATRAASCDPRPRRTARRAAAP